MYLSPIKTEICKMFYYTKNLNNVFAYTHAQQLIHLKIKNTKKQKIPEYDTMNYNQYYQYGKRYNK